MSPVRSRTTGPLIEDDICTAKGGTSAVIRGTGPDDFAVVGQRTDSEGGAIEGDKLGRHQRRWNSVFFR